MTYLNLERVGVRLTVTVSDLDGEVSDTQVFVLVIERCGHLQFLVYLPWEGGRERERLRKVETEIET